MQIKSIINNHSGIYGFRVLLTGPLVTGAMRIWLFGMLIAFAAITTVYAESDSEPLRVGVLQFGTVNWELDVVKTHGLAKKEGVEFKVIPLASKSATNVAIQGGAVDVIVSDWLWVSRQRSEGRDYTFVPYSLATGSIVVWPNKGIRKFSDLDGHRMGVAGGPVDKSWLLMRAYSRKTQQEDLRDFVKPSFAAPPLLNELALKGDLDAVLNYWHYGARLEAAGMAPLIDVEEVLSALGINASVPLIGWVFDESWAAEHRQQLTGFLRATYAAKLILAESDEEWERIRPLVNVSDDATLLVIKEAYKKGIPHVFGENEIEAARKMYEVLAQEGGPELVGKGKELSEGTFWTGFRIEPGLNIENSSQ